MNQPNELEQVEISIEQAKAAIDMKNSLINLSKNKDFEKVIHKEFFENEAIRLVMVKSDPSMSSVENQEAILKSMDAIGNLRQFFQTVIARGTQMEQALLENEQAREEILSEELTGEVV